MRIATFAGVWLMIALVAACASGPDMIPLKTDVTDMKAALERLALFEIPVEASEENKALLVPENHENHVVLILGSAKLLPNAREAYPFLSDPDLTMTDSRRQEAMRGAAEELLGEIIGLLRIIRHAEVRLNPPVKSWNWNPTKDTNRAKATVAIELNNASTIDDLTLVLIADLAAYAYPCLPIENVTITDIKGRPWRVRGGPYMIPLKTPVSDPDRAIERLAMFQIPSRWDDAEKTLYVPEDKEKNAVWVLGSAKLLPDAQTKYAFLSEADLTEADDRMKEQIRVTLEDILGQTLEAMDFIKTAEVRLTLPPAKRITDHLPEQKINKASVAIELEGQEQLNDSQVAAIIQVISYAYPNLPPENVAITDTNGRVYRSTEQKR